MREKMFLSAILTITVILFAGGCGKQTMPVSAEPTETAQEVDTEESLEPTPSPTVEQEESTESSEVEDKEAEPAQTAQPANTAPPAQTARPANTAQPTQTAQPAKTTQPAKTAQPAQTTQPTKTAQPAQTTQPTKTTQPAQTTQPAKTAQSTPASVHTHSWKEHTVTKQVWVPNIVIIPEYEETVVGRVPDVFICDCGYTTTDRDDIAQHVKDCIRSGNSSGFTIQSGHDVVESVQVGYHEEDRGHYETQTYVDYYYCECGEIKN